MSDNRNLFIWDKGFTTDPSHTKEYTGPGGFSGTSIAAMYVVQKATEIFGPLGKGWGYTIKQERYDQGVPLTELGIEPIIYGSSHTILLELWYRDPEDKEDKARYTIEQFGHTPYIAKDKWGIKADPEAPKKSLTDAMKKCLSLLGIAADVYMGFHDDVHYVNAVANQSALEKADDKIEKKAEQEAEYKEWVNNNLRLLSTAVNLNELEKVFKSVVRKMTLRQDNANILAATKAKDVRKSELEVKT